MSSVYFLVGIFQINDFIFRKALFNQNYLVERYVKLCCQGIINTRALV